MARRQRRHNHRKGGSRGYSQRRMNEREVRQRFLIVCEGEKTEPQYFGSFRVPKHVVKVTARGFGISPCRLVDKAVKLRQEDEYDQVWCVFDRDACGDDDFNRAIQRATNVGVQVAYSNQAFELWYLLHFHFYNTPMHRKDYEEKLNGLLLRSYCKNAPDMYEQLYFRQADAIQNADRLLKEYSPRNPAADDPSTTVHLLVQALNRFVPDRNKER